ncbi:MAG: alpha/beta hydrolase fold domain-containing protein [Candidatus Lokiarchaeota archaeon]|nr:alpha/beta hydrolase fold domain-containing protein [Candidatus Lokiarchaeota archaeon]
MVSKGMRRVLKLLEKRNEIEIHNRVRESRESLDSLAALVDLPSEITLTHIEINGMNAVWIDSPEADSQKVILYLHGGGYIEGSLSSHQDLAMRIGKASKARILLIDYRLAPENPFPAALNDAVSAYEWLIEKQGIPSSQVIIAGDSAGGGLTIATLLRLKELAKALPSAAICLSPWTDLAMEGDSIKANSNQDKFLKLYDLLFMASLYIQDKYPKNPLISPLYGDLSGLPPLFIQVGSLEILLDDAARLAKKAEKAGVDVKLDVWDDMIHVFQAFADWAPEGEEAIKKIGQFAQAHFG